MVTENQNNIESDGLGFDPIAFARNIFDAIEPYRSQLGPKPTDIISSPSEEGSSGTKAENRLNAFLRLLGFPATRDEEVLGRVLTDIQKEKLNRSSISKQAIFSQDGTINYIPNITTINLINAPAALKRRNDMSVLPVSGEQFNKLLEDPLEFDAGIKNSTRRVSLFPLIVDASIPVYPLERRMAPLFNNGDYTIGDKTRLSRPFIEHIIYIRAKQLSGFNDSTVLNDLKQSIDDVLPGDNTVTNILADPNPSAIELFITQKFIQTIKRLVIDYEKSIQDAKRAIAEIKFLPTYVAYPDERSKTNIANSGDVSGFALDEKIQELERVLREKEAMIFLLPTEFVNRSDRTRRMGDEVEIHNFKEDIFIGNFTDLLTYEAKNIKEELKNAKAERQRKVQIIEKAKRDLMYFTGEFTGLSIFDVVCVLYALFTVELRSVVGLMNKDALARFMSDPFFSASTDTGSIRTFKTINDILTGDVSTLPSVEDSVIAVQKKVEEAYSIAELFQADMKVQRQRG